MKTQQWWQQHNQLYDQVFPLRKKLYGRLLIQLRSQIENQLWKQLWQQIAEPFFAYDCYHYIEEKSESVSISYGIWFDFCISVLGLAHDKLPGKSINHYSTSNECGWVFRLNFDRVCLICDRPIKLSLDDENRLHAEGEPAIQFADGYTLYSYHGVSLPKKYGQLPSTQWQSRWLLEEKNVEVRQVLIQQIGYTRICR